MNFIYIYIYIYIYLIKQFHSIELVYDHYFFITAWDVPAKARGLLDDDLLSLDDESFGRNFRGAGSMGIKKDPTDGGTVIYKSIFSGNLPWNLGLKNTWNRYLQSIGSWNCHWLEFQSINLADLLGLALTDLMEFSDHRIFRHQMILMELNDLFDPVFWDPFDNVVH